MFKMIAIGIILILVVSWITFEILGLFTPKCKKTLDCQNEDEKNASKFPVTSKSGHQYYVEIRHEPDGWNYPYLCNVYTGSCENRYDFAYKRVFYLEFDFEKFNYDYIRVASIMVERYEKERDERVKSVKAQRAMVAKNKKLFSEWNGVIK